MAIFACAPHATLQTGRNIYHRGDFSRAGDALAEGEVARRDRLLALLEMGSAYQAAGDYRRSSDAWIEAEKLMEARDIIKIGEELLILAADSRLREYRPAPYEKPVLHAMLALNFLMLADWDAARVETVKALHDLDDREAALDMPIPFPRYVAALVFEIHGDDASALIEYRKVHAATGDTQLLPVMAMLAERLGFYEEAQQYGDRYAQTILPGGSWIGSSSDTAQQFLAAIHPSAAPADTKPMAVARPAVVFGFLGRGPKMSSTWLVTPEGLKIELPTFEPRRNYVMSMQVSPSSLGSTRLTSINNLAEKYSEKLAMVEIVREAIRYKARRDLAEKVGEKFGETTEDLLKTMLFFATAPDLRSWDLLPAEIHVVRYPVFDAVDIPYIKCVANTGAPIDPITASTPAFNSHQRLPLALFHAW